MRATSRRRMSCVPAASSRVVLFLDEFRSDEWTQLALTLQGDLGWGQLTSATSYFTRDIADLQDSTDYTFFVSGISDPILCADDPTCLNCSLRLRPGPGGPRLRAEDHTDRFAQEFRLQGATGKSDLARRPFLRAHG